MTIDESITAVNELVKTLQRMSTQTPFIVSTAEKMRGVAALLTEHKRLAAPIPKALGDLSDLPDELLRELSVTKTDELEDQILTVMRACQGEANLDQVLVGLFRKFKVVQTRRFIQNKLYRMSKKELVYQVAGQRAAYSLDPQSASGGPPPDSYDEGDSYSNLVVKPKPARRPDYDPNLDDEIPF